MWQQVADMIYLWYIIVTKNMQAIKGKLNWQQEYD